MTDTDNNTGYGNTWWIVLLNFFFWTSIFYLLFRCCYRRQYYATTRQPVVVYVVEDPNSPGDARYAPYQPSASLQQPFSQGAPVYGQPVYGSSGYNSGSSGYPAGQAKAVPPYGYPTQC